MRVGRSEVTIYTLNVVSLEKTDMYNLSKLSAHEVNELDQTLY